ncbi:ATP-binding cassette sub-family G member 1 [Bradysia coprophila]|uniref:ATP-binding cassette sub-family G member 1 n=1 Tax=Bradysia coprophila TaxID=38358 RepID=UPI00187DA443|nr:ATP-binding cassette sub-family G member 1 [Bradysia coprophila]
MKTDSQRFGCCSGNDDISVENSSMTCGDSTDVDECIPVNNVKVFVDQPDDGIEFPNRTSMDLQFQDIKYTVGKFSLRNRKYETKTILNGLHGEFKSGELTAIMGPSGAGKTTLLNILAGYVQTGVTGKIKVNGKNRSSNSQSFRSLAAYIHQDDALRPYLTVSEAMTIATNLKLGYNVTKEYKTSMIKNILVLLGLEKRYKTYTGRLSGGQKKRLAIALEMINNPPIIFLDEPTTGLDSSSCTQCITLLKRLAQEGRTIVCTIHQPSALIFEMFDKLYAVAGGTCIYQGPVRQLIPFMANSGMACPSYHNPADFLMEIASGDYGSEVTSSMASAVQKQCNETFNAGILIDEHLTVTEGMEKNLMTTESRNKVYKFTQTSANVDYMDTITNHPKSQSASLFMQFYLLFMRNVKSTIRNTFLILARIFSHIAIAFLFGYIYVNVGATATTVLANYVYLYGTILLIVYTGKMSVVLSFPLEMEILTREHFNQWYKLGPYYLSIITFEIPFQMFCSMLYVVISYYLTGNYYEPYRAASFMLMCMLVTICAQSWGFFIGATLPVKLAVFIGPILAVLFSVFGFCTRYIDITAMFSWMWHISYFRAGFHGIINTVYGMNRPYLPCPENAPFHYCHFKNPKLFLEEMLIPPEVTLTDNVVLMSSVFFTLHILTVIALWLKLNRR